MRWLARLFHAFPQCSPATAGTLVVLSLMEGPRAWGQKVLRPFVDKVSKASVLNKLEFDVARMAQKAANLSGRMRMIDDELRLRITLFAQRTASVLGIKNISQICFSHPEVLPESIKRPTIGTRHPQKFRMFVATLSAPMLQTILAACTASKITFGLLHFANATDSRPYVVHHDLSVRGAMFLGAGHPAFLAPSGDAQSISRIFLKVCQSFTDQAARTGFGQHRRWEYIA